MKCLGFKETCLEYKDGECLSLGNCMHQGDVYKHYKLNLDKVNSVDDCKKILKFLCNLEIKPLPEGVCYNGFGEVEEYFS